MPTESPDVIAMATTAGFAAASAGAVVASRQMTKREVFFHVWGAAVLGAAFPAAILHFTGWPAVYSYPVGVIIGASVTLIFGMIPKLVEKWINGKSDTTPSGGQP